MPKRHCGDRFCKGTCQHCYEINQLWKPKRKSRTSNRDFPPDNGTVNGQSAYVKQTGDRTEAYTGQDKEGKIVTNDGRNASFIRNDDGKVIIDDSKEDPYEPYYFDRG